MLPQLALLCVRTGVQDEDDDHGRTVPPLDHVSSRGATGDSHTHKGRAGANPVAHACAHGCGVTHSQQHVVTAILVRACPSPGKQLHVSRGGGLMTCPIMRRRL